MREYQISEEYRTGIEQIDQQHAKLLDHTQRAYELFADENMLFKSEDIRNILEGLDYYSEVHFAYEEAYMEEIGFEGMEAHKRPVSYTHLSSSRNRQKGEKYAQV